MIKCKLLNKLPRQSHMVLSTNWEMNLKLYTYVLGWIIKENKTIVSKEIILVDQPDTIMNKLKPTETVNKMLISTTSRLVGEYEHKDFLITHAWPSSQSKSQISLGFTENPSCRNYYVFAFTSLKITALGSDQAKLLM